MRKGCGGTGIEGDEGDSFGHVPGGSLIPIQMRRGLHVMFIGIYAMFPIEEEITELDSLFACSIVYVAE